MTYKTNVELAGMSPGKPLPARHVSSNNKTSPPYEGVQVRQYDAQLPASDAADAQCQKTGNHDLCILGYTAWGARPSLVELDSTVQVIGRLLPTAVRHVSRMKLTRVHETDVMVGKIKGPMRKHPDVVRGLAD